MRKVLHRGWTIRTTNRDMKCPLLAQVLSAIRALKDDNLTILLVEQNARAALSIADRAYVMETGKITLSGSAAEIRSDRCVREAYLGI